MSVPLLLAGGDKGNRKEGPPSGDAANFLRLVNAAEVDHFVSTGHYAALAELIRSQKLQNPRIPISGLDLQSASEPMRGFHFRLLLSADQLQYQLALREKTPACGLSLFSDESGVLYEARTLGCAGDTSGSVAVADWAPPDVDELTPSARRDVPCPLSTLLQQASRRAEALVANLQRFSAREQIAHIKISKNGHVRVVANRTFNYVAQISQDAGAPSVEEYRRGTQPEVDNEVGLYDTGSAAFALIFHPRYIADYAVTCEGLADSQARPTWQVHFAQRPDRPNQFHVLRLGNSYFPLSLKGRAWIAADNYEVLRLETDLQEPVSKISLAREHLSIEYGPVEFRTKGVRLWLPQTADLYIDYRGHRYQRRHKFSDFKLFWVETGEQVKAPQPPAGNSSQNN